MNENDAYVLIVSQIACIPDYRVEEQEIVCKCTFHLICKGRGCSQYLELFCLAKQHRYSGRIGNIIIMTHYVGTWYDGISHCSPEIFFDWPIILRS